MAKQERFPHLEIINPKLGPASSSSPRFPFFPRLPPELRSEIWRLTLRKERLIPVTVKTSLSCPREIKQAYGNASDDADNERCIPCLTGHRVYPQLLRVNQESRREALRFYRIRIPVVFTDFEASSGRHSKGILYINPESDVLRISPEWPARDSLVEFLFRLKTMYDPSHVGLLNLAIDHKGLSGNDLSQLDLEDLPSEVRRAFTETLAQLQQVFFSSLVETGRTMFGWSSGVSDDTFFNRSLPIMPGAPNFERLRRDPRPIAEDLKRIYVGMTNPRYMEWLWSSNLQNWGISPQKNVQYRFLLAYVGFQQPQPEAYICDRSSAEEMLHKEDRLWRRLPEPDEDGRSALPKPAPLVLPGYPSAEQIASEDLDKAVRPAFGFWLFPQLPKDPPRISNGPFCHIERVSRIRDMSAHPPELCLCDLF